MPSPAALTIVQLTDCHLFADRAGEWNGVATWERLGQVLRELRARDEHFDLLVVTGDTADDEELTTYEAFRDELGEWLGLLRIVPGNHDDRELILRTFPAACERTGGRATFHLLRAGWQLIGLDSQLTGEDAGKLGRAQLAWLRSLLEAAPERDTVVFVHHPPIEVGTPWLDAIGLRDAAALAALLGVHPQVRLVFSGHIHHDISGSLGGARVHTTPAVAPQIRSGSDGFEVAPGPPGYRVIELYPGGRFATRVARVGES